MFLVWVDILVKAVPWVDILVKFVIVVLHILTAFMFVVWVDILVKAIALVDILVKAIACNVCDFAIAIAWVGILVWSASATSLAQ